MKPIFVSCSHVYDHSRNDLKSIENNPNNDVEFKDRSLIAPICNNYGDVIRRPPDDPLAVPVIIEIKKLIHSSNGMIVLVGPDTHSSLWVNLEIKIFRDMGKKDKNIKLMRIKGDFTSGKPREAHDLNISDWNVQELIDWLKEV